LDVDIGRRKSKQNLNDPNFWRKSGPIESVGVEVEREREGRN